MRGRGAALFAAVLCFCASPAHTKVVATSATTSDGWRLAWNDEFSGTALDTTKWRALKAPRDGLGDTEFFDTARYLRVEDGVLKLIAHSTWFGNFKSAMVETQGLAAWRHGRFEARIRVPSGEGTNSAFWMMNRTPTSEPWPLGGEIDILEQLGREPRRAYGTLHFKGEEKIRYGGILDVDKPFHEDFHVFALEWEEDRFAWFIDGVKYHEVRNVPQSHPDRPLYPFDRPYFMMLSNVIGGKWPGRPRLWATWPKVMEVDWVRVYQRDEGRAPEAPPNKH